MTGPGRGDVRPEDISQRDEDRLDAAALTERAAAHAATLATGTDWEACLRLAARQPAWSFTNLMLIGAQMPAATALAGYDEWKARARQVRRGEPGIKVIAEPGLATGGPAAKSRPGTADRHRAARAAYVWDVSQTSGRPHPVDTGQGPDSGAMLAGLWEALTWLARREGFTVTRRDRGLDSGITSWRDRVITIQPDLGRDGETWALVHELSHVLAHQSNAIVPDATTAPCTGTRKVEADSIAFIVTTRLNGQSPDCRWPSPASWAGTDPRAHPPETILAAGGRIVAAADVITAHLATALHGAPLPDLVRTAMAVPRQARGNGHRGPADRAPNTAATPAPAPDPAPEPAAARGPSRESLDQVLTAAEEFFADRASGSWVPGYLQARGFGQSMRVTWRIGYAPAGWTDLLDHLRALGHDDEAIVAAGLARHSARGTLVDHFRDRVMLAVRDEHGTIAGFLGRARPGAGSGTPKYLNGPQTTRYVKGDLLFGLHEARRRLAAGAVPVIAEGPFDAIAVSTAGMGEFAGLAPCGTALTVRQLAGLACVIDLARTQILIALDGDRAGREAAIRAYRILVPVTGRAAAVLLPAGRDPAGILQDEGPAALRGILRHEVRPLAQVVIDDHLGKRAYDLDQAEGQLHAMRSSAALIASLLSPETAQSIRHVTGGRVISTLDEDLHPVSDARVPAIAHVLPTGALCQIARVADRLRSDYSDVVAEVANVVTRSPAGTAHAGTRPPRRTVGELPDLAAALGTAAIAARADPDRPPACRTPQRRQGRIPR